MIIDSSAIIAVLLDEQDAKNLVIALQVGGPIRMSAGSYLEISTVIAHFRDQALTARFEELVQEYEIEVTPFTREQALIGRFAYREFGRGSGHPAGLNFGDCFSYALAADFGEPLLCKGNDFKQTDLKLVSVPTGEE